MSKWTSIVGILVILLIGTILLVMVAKKANAPTTVVPEPANFEECVAAGYPVMESYPRQCNTPSGGHFVEDISSTPSPGGNADEKKDLIVAAEPSVGATITSPLNITGQARGNWYFEASFPIELQDKDGKVLAQHYAEAEGEWMTTEFVPFTATLTFPPQQKGTTGTLMLRKDNPSGLAENEDALVIPVVF